MTDDYGESESTLDRLTELADRKRELSEKVAVLDCEIKTLAVRAFEQGARKYSISAAALVSRPTIDDWIRRAGVSR